VCSVSAIVQQWTDTASPNFQPLQALKPDTAALMLQIITKLEELDRKVNAINCKLAEPEKEAFKEKLAKIAEIAQ